MLEKGGREIMSKRQPSQEEIEALQAVLDNDGQTVITIGSKLGQEAAALVLSTAKPIKQLQTRLVKDALKHIVAGDNATDYISTSLLNGVNTWMQEAEMLLQNIGVKAGMITPGDTINQALANEVAEGPQIEYMGTLLLAVKEAVPWLDRIACALEKIAARLTQETEESVTLPESDEDATPLPSLALEAPAPIAEESPEYLLEDAPPDMAQE